MVATAAVIMRVRLRSVQRLARLADVAATVRHVAHLNGGEDALNQPAPLWRQATDSLGLALNARLPLQAVCPLRSIGMPLQHAHVDERHTSGRGALVRAL